MVSARFRICLKLGIDAAFADRAGAAHIRKTAGFPPPFRYRFLIGSCRDQRSSCSTLCCDWLARASAETAIDWRVDSAWLLAASSLESAKVRLDEPVCSTLIRFLAKSWRICTIDRLEPSDEASDRNWSEAALTLATTALAELLSRKSVPAVSGARPRPAAS